MILLEITHFDKKKILLTFDDHDSLTVYRSEIKHLALREGMEVPENVYEQLLCEVIGKRAVKYAMHLLERRDRTEHQLKEKLVQAGYPNRAIAMAVEYVTSYHYLDDFRYASVFIRCYQEKRSRRRLSNDLAGKGIARQTIADALEAEFQGGEEEQIRMLLEKRRFVGSQSDDREFRRTYQFLLRKGYASSMVLKVMKSSEMDAEFA